ncbi:ABC transporter substrate-binding protein [Streptomyces sp. WAC 06738]|uniref:MCE family protein n=1 Tax=Streptomyces sp. WAC 06738 TaxID=2203210 RepID=UPI000F6F537E|nr:MCE family protein [Streptomyces sp. WAC 06738]AZM46535.1 ABC transporter substrate-binding protein [Streptomyces sp. WAC 06738]
MSRLETTGRRTAGLVFLLVMALLVWLSVAVYQKEFTDTATVTVETGSVGNEMHPYAEVKLRGVVVGEVREISAENGGRTARLTLALDPGQLDRIPAGVSAQMLPTTLFGERFVSLVPPADGGTAGETLAAGSVIPQDRSENAIELEQVLDNVMPLLTAVKPAKLSATLTAMADALDGRGEKLGDTLVELDEHLRKLNPHLPTLNRDIRELVEFGHLYADTVPDLTKALRDATTTSGTIAEKAQDLGGLYGTLTTTSQDLDTFLEQNRENIIRLSADSRPTVEKMAEYAPSFPCTLRTLADFVPVMDKALGKGTAEPGLHVDVEVLPARGKYVPGRDTPRFDAGGGPRCYGVPYTGAPAGSGSAAGRPQSAKTLATEPATDEQALGLPNSPAENQLVNELLAAGMESPPDDLPDWSSVLAGPVFRGTEVRLK